MASGGSELGYRSNVGHVNHYFIYETSWLLNLKYCLILRKENLFPSGASPTVVADKYLLVLHKQIRPRVQKSAISTE